MNTPVRPKAVQLTMTFNSGVNSSSVVWESQEVLGTITSSFESPYTGTELELVIRTLDTLQSSDAKIPQADIDQLVNLQLFKSHTSSPAALHCTIGRTIYQALTKDVNGARALQVIRDYAAAQKRPLALQLLFPPDAVELSALPWELLWDEHPTPLLFSRGMLASCTRHLDLAQPLPPHRPTNQGAIRILAIKPHFNIPVAIHQAESVTRLQTWQPFIDRGAVLMKELSPARPYELVKTIRTFQPDIIHYYGHGRYINGTGQLLLDGDDGGGVWTEAAQIAAVFGDVRLVVLLACQSATIGVADDQPLGVLTGVAPALSAAGIPLVIAMQLTMQMTTALQSSRLMYEALVAGESVQDAVSAVRQMLYFTQDEHESWYVPTLYVRSRDLQPAYLF